MSEAEDAEPLEAPTGGQPGGRFYAACEKCEWTSHLYVHRAGAQGAQSTHNYHKHRDDVATVEEVPADE